VGSEDEAQEPEYPRPADDDIKYYLLPEQSFVILGKRWLSMSAVAVVIYSFHLVMAIYAVNCYTDVR